PQAAIGGAFDHDRIPRAHRSEQLGRKLFGGLGISAPAARGQSPEQRIHQLAAGKDYIYPCSVNELRKILVKPGPLRTKLEHVAKHGYPAAELLTRRKA